MYYFATTETVTGLGSSRQGMGKEKAPVLLTESRGRSTGKIYAVVKSRQISFLSSPIFRQSERSPDTAESNPGAAVPIASRAHTESAKPIRSIGDRAISVRWLLN